MSGASNWTREGALGEEDPPSSEGYAPSAAAGLGARSTPSDERSERAAAHRAAVSATEPDLARERVGRFEWNPSRKLIASVRAYQRAQARGGLLGKLGARRAVLAHRFWSAVTGADIPLNCQLGLGLLCPHPNGIVIHPEARLGPNCLVFQQVTIGAGSKPGLPVIEGHVDIGAGAKVLGPVRVGAHARIGANSVVVSDVPEGATVVGIPARVVGRAG